MVKLWHLRSTEFPQSQARIRCGPGAISPRFPPTAAGSPLRRRGVVPSWTRWLPCRPTTTRTDNVALNWKEDMLNTNSLMVLRKDAKRKKFASLESYHRKRKTASAICASILYRFEFCTQKRPECRSGMKKRRTFRPDQAGLPVRRKMGTCHFGWRELREYPGLTRKRSTIGKFKINAKNGGKFSLICVIQGASWKNESSQMCSGGKRDGCSESRLSSEMSWTGTDIPRRNSIMPRLFFRIHIQLTYSSPLQKKLRMKELHSPFW